MALLGKVIGGIAGFAIGGPIGAIAGLAIGNCVDKSNNSNYSKSNSVSKNYSSDILSSSNEESKTNLNVTYGKDFHSKIVGVTFDNRQNLIKNLTVSQELKLIREYDNNYDNNAIKVCTLSGSQLGYISKETAKNLSKSIDSGKKYKVTVSDITGGGNYSYGANIHITEVNYNSSNYNENYYDDTYLDENGRDVDYMSTEDLNEYYGYERDYTGDWD